MSSSGPQSSHRRQFLLLSLTSLGVVYGDIGTSPLYAVRECFSGEHALPASPENVLGVLSLVFWTVTLVVSAKYLLYVLRADNRGEGGILALMALALSRAAPGSRIARGVGLLGLLGAALLYGDGAITPAMSVLSAMEGIQISAPAMGPFIVPLTVAVLFALFAAQRRGTARIGIAFGPVTLIWFVAIAALGLVAVVRTPAVLAALNPAHGIDLLARTGARGFLVLGAVFLVVTGAEALYADMGHFGRRPIRWTWFSVVKPALLLNYFGQGALLLVEPAAAQNPFYYLVPVWGRLAMVGLATAATIIASQALISGAFSLTQQASMLGYWPRVTIRHTSAAQAGQIYVPAANWLLFLATAVLVVHFGSSTRLAGAYGIAVSATMLITTLLAAVVARGAWRWRSAVVLGLTATLLVPDLAFFGANALKIPQGGAVPLVLAAGVLLLMTTWKRGRVLLAARLRESIVTFEDFCELMRIERPVRVPGTAVFMTATPQGMPPTLMRNFAHNRAVHARNILLTVVTLDVPRVAEEERLRVKTLEDGFIRVEARYGFMEDPSIPALLGGAHIEGLDLGYVSYFFGREVLLADSDTGMARWRKRVFGLMAKAAEQATAFFHIPPGQVVEMGAQVQL